MKAVRECLFEKFSEDSDPIEDMGIGIEHQIRKFIEIEFFLSPQDNSSITPERIFMRCLSRNKHDYVEYLIKKEGIDPNFGDGNPLRVQAYHHKSNMCRFLIKLGADLDMALKHAKDANEHETYMVLQSLKNMENKK